VFGEPESDGGGTSAGTGAGVAANVPTPDYLRRR